MKTWAGRKRGAADSGMIEIRAYQARPPKYYSRAHLAPFCARGLLKIIAVSENAPGAHRDVPHSADVPRTGRRTRNVIGNFESPSFREANSPF